MTPPPVPRMPSASMAAPQVRLFLFHAASVPLTVILRRGPSRVHRLILWHRDTGRFEDGQWLKAGIDADQCALSPDGRHFLALVLDGAQWRHGFGAYTVLCRPPYFTALSLFPAQDPWIGGGTFHGTAHFDIRARHRTEDIYANDTGLTRVFPTATGHAFRDNTPFTPPAATADGILPEYATDAGKLLGTRDGTTQLIRDFTDMTFAPIVAPYAAETGRRAPWHPLDHEEAPPCP